MPHRSRVLKTQFCTWRTLDLKKNRGRTIWRGWRGTIWSEEEERRDDLKRHNLSKEEERRARSGLHICHGRTKKKKEKRSDEDEETQQMKKPKTKMKKPRMKNDLTMKTKKVKLESLKLEFHVDFYPHHLSPLTNRDLKTRFLS